MPHAANAHRLAGLDWLPAHRKASLERVCEHVLDLAHEAAQLQARRASVARRVARGLNAAALLLATLAAMLPILSQMYAGGPWWTEPGSGALLLIAAGGVFTGNRLFALERTARRAARASAAIREEAQHFEMCWLQEIVGWPQGDLSVEQTRRLIALCDRFRAQTQHRASGAARTEAERGAGADGWRESPLSEIDAPADLAASRLASAKTPSPATAVSATEVAGPVSSSSGSAGSSAGVSGPPRESVVAPGAVSSPRISVESQPARVRTALPPRRRPEYHDDD